jgi:hypothetical protein
MKQTGDQWVQAVATDRCFILGVLPERTLESVQYLTTAALHSNITGLVTHMFTRSSCGCDSLFQASSPHAHSTPSHPDSTCCSEPICDDV